jgi:hypothetical protein
VLFLQPDPHDLLCNCGVFRSVLGDDDPRPVQTFGYILSIWVFLIAALFPAMGAYVTFADLCPVEAMIQSLQFKLNP